MNNQNFAQTTLYQQDDISITLNFDDCKIKEQINSIKKISPKTNFKLKGSHRAVYPIKSKDTIAQIKDYLLTRPERYAGTNILRYTFFCFGINQVLRISDIQNILIDDVMNADGTIKDYFVVDKEQKTGKRNVVFMNDSIKEVLKPYLAYKRMQGHCLPSDYLFTNRNNKQLSRYSAWGYMKDVEDALSLQFSLGVHSLRKTCAYQMWNNGTDIYVVSSALNHSSLNVTKRYVTIDEDEIKSAYLNNCL